MSIEKLNSPELSSFSHILSHATKVPGLIFLSGQTPTDKTGKVVEGGIKEHTVSRSLQIAAGSWLFAGSMHFEPRSCLDRGWLFVGEGGQGSQFQPVNDLDLR
jgi:hypothetical protein